MPPGALRLEYLDPADLEANPANWRLHPPAQLAAITEVIAEVGWAGALLFNERTKRLIDGHARKSLFAGKGPVPVLIGDWTAEQEKKILLSLDPITSMAEANRSALDALLRDVETGGQALAAMLTQVAEAADVIPKETEEVLPAPEDSAKCPTCGRLNP